MKGKRVRGALVVFAVVLVGIYYWLTREQPTSNLMLTTTFVRTEAAAVRIDGFELTKVMPGPLRWFPPPWLGRYPALEEAWVRLFRGTERVREGLVWIVVEATVESSEALDWDELEYRLDYGSYTMGPRGGGFSSLSAARVYRVESRFEVTDGLLPEALEILVKGEWLRFPIKLR